MCISSGCHNKIPLTRWLTQQIFIPHSSGGRKSQNKVLANLVAGEGSLSGLQVASSHLRGRNSYKVITPIDLGLPRWLRGKESAWNAGHAGLIPGSGRYPGDGNGHSLQYSCLENPMDRGGWRATVHRVTKSRTVPTRLRTCTPIGLRSHPYVFFLTLIMF